MPDDFESFLATAQKAARLAGEIILDKLHTAKVSEKSAKDLVTDADVAAQKIIYETLLTQFPSHSFLGEETIEEAATPSNSVLTGDQWCWVVDPIDGTVNYVHGLPNFCVSIALVQNSQPHVGIVYDPMADEMFTATRDGGAFLNGQPIQASQCRSIDQALIAASFPPNVQRNSPEVAQFVQVLVESQSVRRLGAAALNLSYVAAGRLDGYWATKVKPWDIAAGALIATEAKAHLTARDGSPFQLIDCNLTVAATPQLHQQLLECLSVE